MSGIGRHEYTKEGRGPYEEDIAVCPYCGYDDCRADYADVGIGLVQCGPFFCPECCASEISCYDTRELTDREKETGWFEPGSPVSDLANTIGGNLVDHTTAKVLYAYGLLDKK